MEHNFNLSREEAREMRRRLEEYYGEPVLPLHRFCNAMELWMDCIRKANTDPELLQGGADHGRSYFKFLGQINIDIRKSNLLGRLLYAKEKFRTQKCPLHKGHWNGETMFFKKCPHNCDGTGWLREKGTDGGYTGIVIREAVVENGELRIIDPETNE